MANALSDQERALIDAYWRAVYEAQARRRCRSTGAGFSAGRVDAPV
jgi:hypothetical protein